MIKAAASGLALLGLLPAGLFLAISPSVGEPLEVRHPPAPMQVAQLQSSTVSRPTPPKVWTTGPLAEVSTNAQPGSQHSVQLSAARNEFESFHVHLRSGSAPVQMNVTVGNFIGPRGFVIHSSSNVVVYREAYLDITALSDVNGTLGVTPDPLIPAIDPYFHESRNAFPVTVPPNQVQSAWIDVQVRTAHFPETIRAW
jgi:hypothetical protein